MKLYVGLYAYIFLFNLYSEHYEGVLSTLPKLGYISKYLIIMCLVLLEMNLNKIVFLK